VRHPVLRAMEPDTVMRRQVRTAAKASPLKAGLILPRAKMSLTLTAPKASQPMPAKVESAKEDAARVVVRAAAGVDIMDADGAVIATVAVVAAADTERVIRTE